MFLVLRPGCVASLTLPGYVLLMPFGSGIYGKGMHMSCTQPTLYMEAAAVDCSGMLAISTKTASVLASIMFSGVHGVHLRSLIHGQVVWALNSIHGYGQRTKETLVIHVLRTWYVSRQHDSGWLKFFKRPKTQWIGRSISGAVRSGRHIQRG